MRNFSKTVAGALGAIVLSAVPARAEVVEQENQAFVTRDSKVVTANLRDTWLAVITPSEWWNSSHTFSGDSANMMLTPQAGGCFCERIPEKETRKSIGLAGSVQHMSVMLAMPDQALRMQGALGPLQSEPVNGILTVTLSEIKEGTRITFEYAVGGYMRFEVPVIAKAVDGVMSQQLGGLAKLLGEVDLPAEEPVAEEKASEEKTDGEDEKPADDEGEPAESKDEAEEKIEPKISVDEAFGDLVVEE